MARILNFTSLFSKVEATTTTTTTTSSSSSSSTTTKSFSSSSSSSYSSWAWPSCKHPKTDPFRRNDVEHVYKTTNSIFFNHDSTDSSFTNPSEDQSLSTLSEDDSETIIRGLTRSDRLFFEPGGDTSSILDEAHNSISTIPFKESLVVAMESEDPYGDFRKSMEEMVAANGAKDWEFLEELLVWYLRVNGKKNHGFIVGAFVDLLVGLSSSSPPCM